MAAHLLAWPWGEQALLRDVPGVGGRSPRVGARLKQAEPRSPPEPPALLPRQLPASLGLLSQGGFIRLTSDAASQRGPSPTGSPADRLCRRGTKRWAVTEGCKSFLVCASPGIRGACWRISPTLKPTTYWTGAALFFLFFLFFFFSPPQSKSLDSHRTQGILLYRNPFFRQLCQECFHTLGWMGKKKGLIP